MSDSSPVVPPAGSTAGPASGARFGIFEVDFEAGELRKRGLRVRLQDQPFRVLRLLLEQPGRVVTREELQSKLWPGDTFVDFDHGLNTAINKIRQALGDSAANPRFVETMHRRGYRFIAPVERVGAAPLAGGENLADLARLRSSAGEPAAGISAGGSRTPEGTPDSPSGMSAYADAGSTPQGPASAEADNGGSKMPEPPGAERKHAELAAARHRRSPLLGAWLRIGGMTVFGVSIALAIATVVMVFGLVQDRLAHFFGQDRDTAEAVSEIRILAGQLSSYTNGRQQEWSADQLYVGGQTSRRVDMVMGAGDPHLFHGERYGRFQYVIPAKPGKYRLTLHFAEFWFGPGNQGGGGPGSRVFDVECNGVELLSDFEVFREAGGARRAIARSFDGITPNDQGNVVVTFLPHVDNAMVNALELTPED